MAKLSTTSLTTAVVVEKVVSHIFKQQFGVICGLICPPKIPRSKALKYTKVGRTSSLGRAVVQVP